VLNSVSALVDSDDDCWLNAIDAVSEKSISVVEANVDKKVTALMNVNDCEVRFQLDSAADASPVLGFFTVRFASPNGFIGVLFHILSVIDVGLT
jgi:hypothetical protein